MLHAAALPIVNLHPVSVFAVLALLTLPVDLRAGLHDPHPHALIQIIDDEADGALDHDHAAVDQGYGLHDHHDHHHAVASTPRDDVSPDLPRFASDDSCVGSGLVAAMIGFLQPPREAPAPRQIIAPPPLRGVAISPPLPPPRLVARPLGADEDS